ncbi:MAG TPA: hypothetical protein VMV92_30120 [Streptosporangiaceae bacterium]|nr:hypothetical protein [Streptosporangiaceae bacterium]
MTGLPAADCWLHPVLAGPSPVTAQGCSPAPPSRPAHRRWEPQRIRWYLDDDLYATITPAGLRPRPWVFDHDFFVLVNLAVGGTISGTPGPAVTFPQTMLVDYIRVYTPAGPG